MIVRENRWARKLMTPIELKAMRTWESMRNRCKNPGCTFYQHYGGRGIKVCDKWQEDFEAFVRDAGLPPSLDVDLDRINNDGNYEPGNVRWISHKENTKNMRTNRRITIDGVTKLMSEWCDEYDIQRPTMFVRLKLGWTGQKLLQPPKGSFLDESYTIDGITKTHCEWALQAGITIGGYRLRWNEGDRGTRLIRPLYSTKKLASQAASA